jgi:hypothetical protein
VLHSEQVYSRAGARVEHVNYNAIKPLQSAEIALPAARSLGELKLPDWRASRNRHTSSAERTL